MKLRYFFVFIITGLFCVNCTFQTFTQNNVFGTPYGTIGIISDNKILFNYIGNWSSVDTSTEMMLPSGYKSAFGIGINVVGVIVNDKIQFYEYDSDKSNKWILDPSFDINLPKGYKGAFGLGFNVGIIKNNKIHFYGHNGDKWFPAKDDMNMPKGCKGVFGLGFDVVGAIVNDKVQFYVYHDNKWTLEHNAEMMLPSGYKGVFGLGVGIVGVVFNDEVQIYVLKDNKWTLEHIIYPIADS